MNSRQDDSVNTGEAVVEGLTFVGLVSVLLMMYAGPLNQRHAMLLAGVILLGSAFYQTSQGWHVAWTTWLLGVVLTLAGLGMSLYVVTFLPINFVGITVVLVGAYLAWQWFGKRR